MPSVTVSQAGAPAVELNYEEYCSDTGGSGIPVVLIHGWPLSHRMWEPQITPLVEAGFRVIAYDRRGFGDSTKASNGYDYDTFAEDLHGLLKALDLQEVVLVGFSMGGGEVARYFGRYGDERVAKAALISAVTPFLLKTDDNPDGVDESVFDDMLAGVKKDRITFMSDFGKGFLGWSEAHKSVPEEHLVHNRNLAWQASPIATQQCITAFGTTDFREDLKRMKVPTLIVHGDNDDIVPCEVSANKAAALLDDNEFHVIKGAPHGLNLTHTAEFNDILLKFLAR